MHWRLYCKFWLSAVFWKVEKIQLEQKGLWAKSSIRTENNLLQLLLLPEPTLTQFAWNPEPAGTLIFYRAWIWQDKVTQLILMYKVHSFVSEMERNKYTYWVKYTNWITTLLNNIHGKMVFIYKIDIFNTIC